MRPLTVNVVTCRMSLSVPVVLLLFTILLMHQPLDDNQVGVEAFVTISSPNKSYITSRNQNHHARISSLLVRQHLATNIPDESIVTATSSEQDEVIESVVSATTETSIAVQDVDDTTSSSSTRSNTESRSSIVTSPKTSTSSPSALFPVDCDEDDTSEECVFGSEEILGECLPEKLVSLPIHTTSKHVNQLLRNTEQILRNMHINSTDIEMSQILAAKEAGRTHECIYANNYVDLGKIDT